MLIFIVDSKGKVGHSTHKCDMISRLLKNGRAKVIGGGLKQGDPIVVKLLDKVFSESEIKDIEYRIGIDPGYRHIGYCVYKIYNNKVVKLFAGEVETRTSEVTKNLSDRKMYRNIRRQHRRKTVKRKFNSVKFRHPIWKNRAKHKFQPTHWHLINSHKNLLNWIFKRIPLEQSKLHIEYNKFDSQKIINPNIYNWQYSKGLQYDFENIKSYVRFRDNYICQICKKKIANIRNEVHHIIPKSKGGSNRPDNLILLCQDCHKKVHTGKTICFPKLIKNKNFRDAGVLNSCMKHMFAKFEDILPTQDTYGHITKVVRHNWRLEKTHANNASIIALCDSNGLVDELKYYDQWLDEKITINFKQYRRHVRNHVHQYEDRKYYIINSKHPKKAVAWNRNRRTGQDKKKRSLTELKQYLLDKKILNKVQIMVKPGRKVYCRNNKDILYRPGDIIKCSKGVDVVRGWLSTQRKVVTEKLGAINQKDCTKILNNCGLVMN